MRLPHPITQLPIAFDAEALAAEVARLPGDAWVPHPDKLPGNAAVRLITPDGGPTEGVSGRMRPTPHLLASPHMMEVLAAVGSVWGRARLMRITAGSTVPPHIDTNFYWRKHVRLHVPIVTNPQVSFHCAAQAVHMGAGECWVLDTFRSHHVRNDGPAARVHMVFDTVGDGRLWDLIAAAAQPNAGAVHRHVFGSSPLTPLQFEDDTDRGVMSPWELRHHIRFIADEAQNHPRLPLALARLDRLVADWTGLWAQFGRDGNPREYRMLLTRLDADLVQLRDPTMRLRNGLPVLRQVAELTHAIGLSLGPATSTAVARTG